MKPVLALECSSEVCSVALATADGVLERTASRPGEQLRVLFPMVMSLLEEARIGASALGRIAVAVGPGSFAGLRLAITTARTMAQVLDVPVVCVSTLRLVGLAIEDAARVTRPDWRPRAICALTDARKGQIFAACFERSDSGLFVEAACLVLSPAEAVAWVGERAGPDVAIGGSALVRYGDVLRAAARDCWEAPAQAWCPHARYAAHVARGDHGPPAEVGYAEVSALYLRPPDVKKPVLPPLRDLS